MWLFDTPIAHRGLHNDILPENSIGAYDQAIKNGFNIEIDVHLSSDGKLVVFHDDDLKRVCGINKKVKDCTFQELTNTRLLGTEYKIPSFDEFLEFVDGRTGVLCEIKGVLPWDTSIAQATCDRLKTYKGKIALQSFNFGAVKYCKQNCDLPSGQLCTWSNKSIKKNGKPTHLLDVMGKLWILRLSKPDFVAYNVLDIQNKYVKKALNKFPFLTWTVNSAEKIELAKQYANNIIFERSDINLIKQSQGKFLPLK